MAAASGCPPSARVGRVGNFEARRLPGTTVIPTFNLPRTPGTAKGSASRSCERDQCNGNDYTAGRRSRDVAGLLRKPQTAWPFRLQLSQAAGFCPGAAAPSRGTEVTGQVCRGRFCRPEVARLFPLSDARQRCPSRCAGGRTADEYVPGYMLDVGALSAPASAARPTPLSSRISPPSRRQTAVAGQAGPLSLDQQRRLSSVHSTSFSISFSSITATPRVFALSSFDPASEPATT
jgi:hypothetical protein